MSQAPSKSKLFTRGGQITFNNLRMLTQVNRKIAHWFVLLIIMLTGIGLWLMVSFDTLQAVYYYALSWVLIKFGFKHHVFHLVWHGRLVHVNTIAVLVEPYFLQQFHLFLHLLKKSFFFSLAISFILMIWTTVWLIKRGKQQAEKYTVRGAEITSPKALSQLIKKLGASDIKIQSVPMVKDFEVKHILIHGTTGAGKGQTFNQFIEQIRKRGESAIIFDKGCVFISLFYHAASDINLNAFDDRCPLWDLWQDAKTEPDFENIAESLIPMHGDSDPYWVDAARTVFAATAFRMRLDKDRSIKKLLSLLLNAELNILGQYLKGTQAGTLVSDKIEKTAISIRSVLSTYLKSLRFLEGLTGKSPFSIKEWVNQAANDKHSHFLFISSNAEQHASMRPLISMWLSMASLALLSLEENYQRRIWFICDELPTLHKLPQLGETIAEVRKFGGCFALGMQSFAQLEKIYGRAGAAEIFDLLNTRFFFRSPSANMAALVSKELGQEEVEQSNESYSYGANTIRDGISIGTQRVTQALVKPAEIMNLPDLNAYLRLPAPVPVTQLKIKYKKRRKIAVGFIARDRLKDIDNQNKASPQEAVESLVESDNEVYGQSNQILADILESHVNVDNQTIKSNQSNNHSVQRQQQEDNILTESARHTKVHPTIELD